MSIDERKRHQMYRRLEEVLGTEEADTMMAHLPPVGWAEVATKHDIEGLRTATKQDLELVRIELRSELQAVRTELGADIQLLRAELGGDIQALRSDMDLGLHGLRADMEAGLHAASAETQTLRADMEAGFHATSAETQKLRADMDAGFQSVRADLGRDIQALGAAVQVQGKSLEANMATQQRKLVLVLVSMMLAINGASIALAGILG